MEVGEGQLTTGDDLIHGTQSGFHHATGHAEDICRAAGEAQGCVELLVRQGEEVNAHDLDQVCQLTGGEHRVNVGHTVVTHLWTGTFRLFGGAGHDGDHIDILRIFLA